MDLCLPFPTWSFQIIAKQILNFPFLWYNDNPFRKRVRDGEFPLLVTQGTSQFPTYGLAVVVKKEFLPLEASLRYASRGRNSFSTTPAKPCVGNWDVPFVTCGEFKIPTTHGFATRGRNFPVPSPPPKGIGPFPWKNLMWAGGPESSCD